MRKIFLVLVPMLLLSSCVTQKVRRSELQYNRIIKLSVGEAVMKNVIAEFGQPTEQLESEETYTLIYRDPKNGFHRATLEFLKNSQKLASILWMPQESEKENSVENVKSGFSGASFKEVHAEADNPHHISNMYYLMDEQIGVTILFDRSQGTVEAIARMDVNRRRPAVSKKTDPVSYSIGETSKK